MLFYANIVPRGDDSWDGHMNLTLVIKDSFTGKILYDRDAYGRVTIDINRVDIDGYTISGFIGDGNTNFGHRIVTAVTNFDQALRHVQKVLHDHGYDVDVTDKLKNFFEQYCSEMQKIREAEYDRLQKIRQAEREAAWQAQADAMMESVRSGKVNFISVDDAWKLDSYDLKKLGFERDADWNWYKPIVRTIGKKKLILKIKPKKQWKQS